MCFFQPNIRQHLPRIGEGGAEGTCRSAVSRGCTRLSETLAWGLRRRRSFFFGSWWPGRWSSCRSASRRMWAAVRQEALPEKQILPTRNKPHITKTVRQETSHILQCHLNFRMSYSRQTSVHKWQNRFNDQLVAIHPRTDSPDCGIHHFKDLNTEQGASPLEVCCYLQRHLKLSVSPFTALFSIMPVKKNQKRYPCGVMKITRHKKRNKLYTFSPNIYDNDLFSSA